MQNTTVVSKRTTFLAVLIGALPILGIGAPAAAYDPALLCAYPTAPEPVAPARVLWSIGPEPSPLELCAPSEPPARAGTEAQVGAAEAREALTRARALAREGRLGEALLVLRVVEQAFPALADRLALEEAGYRMEAGPDELACAAFARAKESPERTVAVRAELGHVDCLLAIGDRRGVRALDELRRSYPELPHASDLQLQLARAHERWGAALEAVRIYRELDLVAPGTAQAAQARDALERLRAEGVQVPELTLAQQVERAERLSTGGYYDAARPELARLRALELPRPLAQQLARSAARIARVEGRWADAQALLREAQGLPSLAPEQLAAMQEQAADMARAAAVRDADAVRRDLRASLRGPLSRQPTGRLFATLHAASRAGVGDLATELARELARRRTVPPALRFEAGIVAAGTAEDAIVLELFGSARGVAALYHHARALERLGRVGEARAEYTQVIAQDDPRLPYYALWARARMLELGSPARAPVADAGGPARLELAAHGLASHPEGPFTPADGAAGKTGERDGRDLVVPRLSDSGALAPELLVEVPALREPEPPAFQRSPEELVRLLRPVADEHGEAYPWLTRAMHLLELGELAAAGDELHEVFVAWRDARGGGSLRSGLAAVLRGAAPPRLRVSPQLVRERRALSSEARARLALVAASLGDHGLAIRFHGFGVTGQRPRAYEDLVHAAATRHGVEPELLFAVMRVESVYNPRIISYAGAIGLMQIMPRTGRLIAHRLGRQDFTVDQLLEPEVNVDFAAWYLASLIERFDGRLPLAIAAYNGGPHNVRRWMRDHADSMPLDAFLERIPFSQTHRYVRRVLTHYAAYRAQRGQQVSSLDVSLPAAAPDPLAF